LLSTLQDKLIVMKTTRWNKIQDALLVQSCKLSQDVHRREVQQLGHKHPRVLPHLCDSLSTNGRLSQPTENKRRTLERELKY
jgi:hypothetical protein